MIIKSNNEESIIKGAEVTKFGLNLKDPSVFTQMLLKLYSNPKKSVVRELVSNAWDSNQDSKNQELVIIGIEGNKFFVQDFGEGMSPEFMNSSEEGYCTIGYSTKRLVNNQLGFYGFGRLSPLACTNQYWISTVYEGVVYEYLIFLDGNVIKQTLLGQRETEEPSGTRVVVQIGSDYYEQKDWKGAIKEQASYFDKTIISLDDKVKVETKREGDIIVSNVPPLELHFVLGSAYYDITWNEFKDWEFLKSIKVGIYIGLDEEVYPTPSRESLLLSENAKQIIKNKFKSFAKTLVEEYEKQISNFDTIDLIRVKAQDSVNFKILDKEVRLSPKNYETICKLINHAPLFINSIPEIVNNEWTVWNQLTNYFKNWNKSAVYSKSGGKLKEKFLTEQGKELVKLGKKFDLSFCVNLSKDDKETSQEFKERKQLLVTKIETELTDLFIAKYYEQFPEEFEKWKKENKTRKKKEGKVGVEYFRSYVNDSSCCTEEKGEIDLSKFPIKLYANKETANKYWALLNFLYPNKFIILTKPTDFTFNLMELTIKASPFLKRMCTEAFKSRTFKVMGNSLKSTEIQKFIRELNPLLGQYFEEVNLFKIHYFSEDSEKALIEAGELLGFNKDEVKLRYIEHHLNKLRLIKKFATSGEYPHYSKIVDEESKEIIRRVYTLERLVEKKKYKEEDEVNENQLTLQLN